MNNVFNVRFGFSFMLLLSGAAFCFQTSISAAEKPNILWLTSEDHGPEMGCYGDSLARTPNVDALASKGMLFKHAWSVAPVCAPARTAIISGIYPSSSGAIHMRSMVDLPDGAKMYPAYLREAGYYCTNNSKEDYNVRTTGKVWDESSGKSHWKNRSDNQPFFAIFNSVKSHESQIRTRPHKKITDPSKVRVPSYHPDTPEVREDWAQYYDKVSEADADAGMHLQELADAGLADDTIVFYYGDHGSGMPRSKRWPSNSGLHIPMVVYFPPKWQHLAPKEYAAGAKSDRLVSFVDLAPTVLSIAGVEPPSWMQGHAFAGPFQSDPQPYIYGERGRMDERMDLVRSVTDGRFVYLRNYFPHVSQAQKVAYQFETPTTRIWHGLFLDEKTTDAQSLFWQVPKPVEELYDLKNDRDEVINLANSEEHQSDLERLRVASLRHIIEVRDVCFLPEVELHKRSGSIAPGDMSKDDNVYPLKKIHEAASLASSLSETGTKPLVAFLADDDSAVRYWGAMGLLMRGKDAIASNFQPLRSLLKDESISVSMVAAQALAEFGTSVDRENAIALLVNFSDPSKHSVLVAMSALAAVEALGPLAEDAHQSITTIEANGPSPDARYNSYVPRLIENIAPNKKRTEGTRPRKAKKTKK